MTRLFIKILRNEIVRYILIGGCTTAVNFISFWIIYDFFNINITLSNVISITLSILFAYVTNRIIVFHSQIKGLKALIKEFTKFFGSRLFTMILEIGGVYFLVNILKQDPMMGKFATQFLVLACNYLISKFIVFK